MHHRLYQVFRAAFRGSIVIAFVATSTLLHAQGLTSSGTDFWAGFFPNEQQSGDVSLTQLFLASTAADTALVTYDGVTTSWPLAANSVATIDLNGRGITDVAETPIDRSVHIQTHAPITVYGFYDVYGFGDGGSPDGFLGLPTTSLGSEYYTVNYTEYNNFAGIESAEFLVIAPYDSTLVTITPTAHTQDEFGNLSHVPGQTWSVMLMKGQSYLVKSSGQFSGIDDLTGSHVVSSKPVALLTGHQMADIPLKQPSADYLIEMEPSSDRWGTEYFEMPMAGRTVCGDYIRILSAEDNNAITANGTPLITLNRGQWIEVNTVTTPQFYQSSNSKRFIVAQYAYSNNYLGDTAEVDPFLVLLTGREEFERRILFRTPDPAQGASYENYVTILAPLSDMSQITINGKAATSYTSAGQAVFPGTTIGALRILLPNGSNSYLATSKTLFGMYQYGISAYEGYGWPAGLSLGLRSGDTLPPVQSVSEACGNYNVTVSETRAPPIYSFEDSRIAEVTMITQTGDPRWPDPSYNYRFTLDSSFHPGDSITRFSLTVIDPSKPAYAAIYAVDFNGNDTVYQYTSAFLSLGGFQHLAVRSGSIGEEITMPLQEDIGDSTYLKQTWNTIVSLTATFSFDPSKLTFVGLIPPAGWTLGTVTNSGNSVTYTITNVSSSPAEPLDLGSATFRVNGTVSGMTRIVLNYLQLQFTNSNDGICLRTSEDALWGVVVLPSSGVSSIGAGQITIRPNPFDDHIAIDDPNDIVTSVEIIDELGRVVLSEAGNGAGDVQTASLLPGAYVIVCHTRNGPKHLRLNKSK